MTKKIDRIEKARMIANSSLCKVTQSRKGLPVNVVVPGSDSKQYQVIIKRNNATKTITTECQLLTPAGTKFCKGNHGTVCYHSVTALFVAAFSKDFEASICKNPQDAERLARIGNRQIFRVKSYSGKKDLFLVVKCEEAKKLNVIKKSPDQLIKELGF